MRNRKSLTLTSACVLGVISWHYFAHEKALLSSSEESDQARQTFAGAQPSAAATNTRDLPSRDKGDSRTTAAAAMDPDATLRSVEQTLRAARSNIFNFKHDGTYGCNLDENLLMKMLAGMNRKWPRIPYELGSVAMEHNLLFREQQALAMLPNDPDGAIHFMEAQIKLELEKDATLRVANPWRESLKKNATGDISLFSRMMEQLPDRHFEAVIDENLTVLNASAGLREIAIANSFKRPVEVRYMTLARLADNGLLKGTPQGQRAEAELLYLIGAPPQAGSWQTEVSRILD